MRCLNPIKAAHSKKGGITFRQKEAEPGMEPFELECRKCLPCRLNVAREKAIRAMHEAQIHPGIFLTLTYNDENLKSDRLMLHDFQQFMDTLRKNRTRGITDPDLKNQLSIPYMVTGEYGEKNKRPHWHALLFNYVPRDAVEDRKTELGHTIWRSDLITKLWGKGATEFGEITLDSANYTARYAAKKLVHGQDEEHEYHPIHKTSSKHAIGKSWIQKHWFRTFENGNIILPNGQPCKIPRYYVDWLKKNEPEYFRKYQLGVRQELQKKAASAARKEELYFLTELINQKNGHPRPLSRSQVKLTILNQKFKLLQGKLKL